MELKPTDLLAALKKAHEKEPRKEDVPVIKEPVEGDGICNPINDANRH